MQTRIAERHHGYRSGRDLVDDLETGRVEGPTEHAIEREPVARFSQRQRGLEGGDVGDNPIGQLVAFGHPALEVGGRSQQVDRVVSTRPHGGGQVEGRVTTDEREIHVTILTGDSPQSKLTSPVEAVTIGTVEHMAQIRHVEVVVFDVLGTMVDEASGLRAGIREAVPASDDALVGELLTRWQGHVECEQQRIARGHRAYANSEVVDGEAASRVADHAGLTDPVIIARLATAGQRLPPWDDSVAGLERLARRFPVLGLSNAGRTALLRLNAHAGLRWHQALSAEAALAYKPAPEVYQLAIDTVGCPPERMLMVAAHAFDLRGAKASGMRTAYVQRPVGDPPTASDDFDWRFDGLDDLVTALTSE